MKYIGIIIFFMMFMESMSGQEIKVSIKIILNPSDGSRPTDLQTNNVVSDTMFANRIDWANELMFGFRRGYKFNLEVEEIGGQGTTVSNNWYNADGNSANRSALDAVAKANPNTYKYRSDMVNIYISGAGGGYCSNPDSGTESITLIGANLSGFYSLYIHEIGHFFGLCHTHDNSSGCDIDDVLSDDPDWDQDGIAQNQYNKNYNQLNTVEKDSVDNVFFNIMSYHTNNDNLRKQRVRFTEGQLDKIYSTTYAYADRGATVYGKPIYVREDQHLPCTITSGNPRGSEHQDIYTCAFADVTSSDDVIVARPGVYSGAPNVISTACIMTATRTGDAIIKP